MGILLKKELLLFIIGGVFVFETISVIIQVSWFQWTKAKELASVLVKFIKE